MDPQTTTPQTPADRAGDQATRASRWRGTSPPPRARRPAGTREAKDQARTVVADPLRATDQAATQQARAASGLRDLAHQLGSMAHGRPGRHGPRTRRRRRTTRRPRRGLARPARPGHPAAGGAQFRSPAPRHLPRDRRGHRCRGRTAEPQPRRRGLTRRLLTATVRTSTEQRFGARREAPEASLPDTGGHPAVARRRPPSTPARRTGTGACRARPRPASCRTPPDHPAGRARRTPSPIGDEGCSARRGTSPPGEAMTEQHHACRLSRHACRPARPVAAVRRRVARRHHDRPVDPAPAGGPAGQGRAQGERGPREGGRRHARRCRGRGPPCADLPLHRRCGGRSETLLDSLGWSALIVGLLWALAAAVMAAMGRTRLSGSPRWPRAPSTPPRTFPTH